MRGRDEGDGVCLGKFFEREIWLVETGMPREAKAVTDLMVYAIARGLPFSYGK
jgi:hypothetical protein